MASGKKKVAPFTIMNALSLASNQTSSLIDVSGLDRVAIEIACVSTTAAGVFTLQGSVSGNVWVTLATDVMNVSGTNPQIMIDVQTTGLRQLRLVYTASSGTGTVNATASGKES